jgi:hypothetical protein
MVDEAKNNELKDIVSELRLLFEQNKYDNHFNDIRGKLEQHSVDIGIVKEKVNKMDSDIGEVKKDTEKLKVQVTSVSNKQLLTKGAVMGAASIGSVVTVLVSWGYKNIDKLKGFFS